MDRISDKTCYIYVLSLPFARWYVGCTTTFDKRMYTHFTKGGAMATKECLPLSIEKVYQLVDYRIKTTPARQVAEVLVANFYAMKYGYDKVRGAKHGQGWNDCASVNSLKIIKRFQKIKDLDEGVLLKSRLKKVDPKSLMKEKTLKYVYG